MNDLDISFRRITKADVPDLVRRQSEPEVAMWYWDLRDEPIEVLVRKWAERATSPGDKTDRYIITVNGHDIGEIQDYLLDDYPEYSGEIAELTRWGEDFGARLPELENGEWHALVA